MAAEEMSIDDELRQEYRRIYGGKDEAEPEAKEKLATVAAKTINDVSDEIERRKTVLSYLISHGISQNDSAETDIGNSDEDGQFESMSKLKESAFTDAIRRRGSR